MRRRTLPAHVRRESTRPTDRATAGPAVEPRMMRAVTLTETGEKDFLAGSDRAFYTPVAGVEARCRWCRRWGHGTGLYHRQVLFIHRSELVCARHVRREDWEESA